MQIWPKDLACQPLFTLQPLPQTQPAQEIRAPWARLLRVGGASRWALPQGQVPPPCFPLLVLCPEPPEGGEIVPRELWEGKNGAPASRNAERTEEELSSGLLGWPGGRCVTRPRLGADGPCEDGHVCLGRRFWLCGCVWQRRREIAICVEKSVSLKPAG